MDGFPNTLADRVKSRGRRAHWAKSTTDITVLQSSTFVETQLAPKPVAHGGGERPRKKARLSVSSAASTAASTSSASLHQIDAAVEGASKIVVSPHIGLTTGQASLSRSSAPFHDIASDTQFACEAKLVFADWKNARRTDAQTRQARRLYILLCSATPPLDNSEARFASTDEAEELVAPNNFFDGPIFTKDQQVLPLQTIQQFLGEFYDDETLVDIQDPSMNIMPNTRRVSIGEVKKRLLRPPKAGEKPWNLLEMTSHVDEGIRPRFLNGEDCRLITKLKIPGTAKIAQRRNYEPGYKEVERWSLLAQAGALTEPHQDSHGYSTFITCNQGEIGFGWLSKPTDEERAAWASAPWDYTGGRWRYVVLRPGWTVYFPAGTVHFVFRLPSKGHTLAFGGHVLRCSTLVHWVKTLLNEKRTSQITNEALTVAAPGYLELVTTFLEQAQKQGTVGRWGGQDQIDEFLRLKAEFLTVQKQPGSSGTRRR